MPTRNWRVMVAALAATIAASSACTDEALGSGPFNLGEDRTESYGAFDPGTIISFGAAFIRNEGDQAGRIESVTLRPAGRDFGANVTEVYVTEMTGIHQTSGLAIGFPPANEAQLTFVPANGATVNGGTTYQLMFVVRLDRPGEWLFGSYDVAYTVGGRRYLATGKNALRVCAPSGVACGKAPARSPTVSQPSKTAT